MSDLERLVEWVLLGAVGLSVALLVAGVGLALLGGEPLPREVMSAESLPAGLRRFEPGAYVSLGLLALIATPFLRVAGSLATFAQRGQWRFVLIAALVLLIMAAGVALAGA